MVSGREESEEKCREMCSSAENLGRLCHRQPCTSAFFRCALHLSFWDFGYWVFFSFSLLESTEKEYMERLTIRNKGRRRIRPRGLLFVVIWRAASSALQAGPVIPLEVSALLVDCPKPSCSVV